MNDEASIRRENLRKLGLTAQELASRVGSGYSYWRGLMTDPKRTFGEKAARRIEDALGLPRGTLDAVHGDGELLQAKPPAAPTAQPEAALDLPAALELLGIELAKLSPELREAAAVNLAGMARAGGQGPWMALLLQLLQTSSQAEPRKQANGR